jgi:5-formyltetrahydrofolate cyclo-ligase
MSGSRTEKTRLRGEALGRRDAMAAEQRAAASRVVAEAAAASLDRAPGAVVAGYLPIRSELDPGPLMAALAARGARLCVPAIVGDVLRFREFAPGAQLVPQGFGTFAPGEDAAVLEPTLVLIPLAAFDRRLHRIGYGRGYYDRALAALRREAHPVAVGLAFACQEVDAVPDEPHDVALDLVVTESGVLRRS